PLGQRVEDRLAALRIARRHDLARRLVVAPKAWPLGHRQGLAVDLDAACVGDVEGRRLQHFAVDAHAPLGDPALGVAARAEAGAGQPLGDALAWLGGLAHLNKLTWRTRRPGRP